MCPGWLRFLLVPLFFTLFGGGSLRAGNGMALDPGEIGVKKNVLFYKEERAALTQVRSAYRGLFLEWEKSYDNVTWQVIPGSLGWRVWVESQFIEVKTYYRRRAFNGISSFYSNVVMVDVVKRIDAGRISGSQLILSGAVPASLGNAISPTGGTGAFTFQWESSLDELTWSTIGGAASNSYQPAALSKKTYFRRKAISGGEECYSNVVQVAINTSPVINSPVPATASGTEPVISLPVYTNLIPDNFKKIATTTLLRPGVTDWNAPPAQFTNKDYVKNIVYLDGISRPLQNIVYKASKSEKDIVSVFAYDALGSQDIGHLPYVAPTDANNAGKFRQDVAVQQPAFYNVLTNNQEAYYYAGNVKENSPSPRIIKTSLPGKSYIGVNANSRTEIKTNSVHDQVRIWEVGDNPADAPYSNSVYESGQLTVKMYTDAADTKVYEYTDKEGKLVMRSVGVTNTDLIEKENRTYYVYDDIRNLRYVISPLATKYCQDNNNWNFSTATAVLKNLCYKYLYDERARVVSAQQPGELEPTLMVYDSRDRVVFTQDATMKMRGQGEWILFFYDGLNRPVMKALYKNATATRESLQTAIMQSTTAADKSSVALPAIADLYLDKRETGRQVYSSTNSITLVPGFESETGADFLIEINPNAPRETEILDVNTQKTFDFGNYEPLSIFYYDNYDWKGAHSFSTDFATGGSNVLYPVAVENVTGITGKVAGYKVKVLGKDQWLTTTLFYDKYDRGIQVQSENIAGGKNIATTQYDFSGKILSTFQVDKNPQVPEWMEMRKKIVYNYERERVKEIAQTIYDKGQAVTKKIATYEYDELGRMKERQLGELETLSYEYTLQGQLSAINRVYAQDQNSGHYFGMELFYDKGFSDKRLDGKVAGVTWRRKGNPDEWHAYGYSYNKEGSLLKADYTQNAGSSWSSSVVDYKVSGLEYDENGNIKKMKQYGMLLGNVKAGIDDLQYTYDNNGWSNQLTKVTDAFGHQQQGDFKDGVNLSKEYDYDPIGSLTRDRNKGVSISYNALLNKPEQILFDSEPGKSITFVYDADGSRLQKIVKDGNKTDTYTFISGYTYKNDKLVMFSHPEGRVRVSSSGKLEYDYFITDHLGNIRTVITDETNQIYYRASHETNPQPAPLVPERDIFSFPKNVDAIPAGNKFYDYNGTNRQFVRLNHNDPDRKIGTAKVLRVMAGDKVEVGVQSYYANNTPANNVPGDLPAQIVTQLITSLLGPTSVIANGHGNILQSNSNGLIINKDDFENFISNNKNNNPPSDVPRAYLNYVLFDDNFKMVDGRPVRVSAPGQIVPLTGVMDIKKNGYLYVYVSNESDTDVFFDDLVVKHTTGHLLQEDSYYPFGLQMRGLSSMALNRQQNDYLYNGIEKISEFDLEVYDAFYRNLDPQLGRWWQVDPMAGSYPGISPYSSNFNDPLNFMDPLGDDPGDPPGLVGMRTSMPFFEVFAKDLSRKVALDQVQTFTTREFTAIAMREMVKRRTLVIDELRRPDLIRMPAMPKPTIAEIYQDKIQPVIKPVDGCYTCPQLNREQYYAREVERMTYETAAGSSYRLMSSAIETTTMEYVGFKVLGGLKYLAATPLMGRMVTSAGEMLGNFGIPKYYVYTNRGRSFFIHTHAMKHLEELATHGAGNPRYLRLLGQTHQKALHAAIDDVASRGAIEFRKMYFSGGNEIMFAAPRAVGELPAVIHFR